MTYVHEQELWPQFRWKAGLLADTLATVRHKQGRLLGRMESLGFNLRAEATLTTLTQDVVKSSEIEGEVLDQEQVRSSIARRLGMDAGGLAPSDRQVEGVVEMMLDATQHYTAPLTEERLFAWHAALFPTGRSGMRRILAGTWRDDRDGPMQVVSGAMGRERVHFQAPTAEHLESEMSSFIGWFNEAGQTDPVLKASLAHLWFVTVHPFDDGNGRIARTIADMALARSENSEQRFYSMSAQIQRERKTYYAVLESTQKGDLDVTDWMVWFLDCLDRAMDGAEVTLSDVLAKARFWDRVGLHTLNERQISVLNRLLSGLEGKLTSSKWGRLTNTSPDTALRDIRELIDRGILARDKEGGRSTSYSLISRSAP